MHVSRHHVTQAAQASLENHLSLFLVGFQAARGLTFRLATQQPGILSPLQFRKQSRHPVCLPFASPLVTCYPNWVYMQGAQLFTIVRESDDQHAWHGVGRPIRSPGHSHAGRRHRLSTVHQCVSEVRQSGALAKNSPTRLPLRIYCGVARSGWPHSLHSFPTGNESRLVVSTVCSSPKWSIATT
jgi:hypothetical protein